jgi:hypothetical protein
MRQSGTLRLALAITILCGSLVLYPAALHANMCDGFNHTIRYWDTMDINGNCPIDHTTVVGEWSIDCDWTVTHWGAQSGCDSELILNEYCGDC